MRAPALGICLSVALLVPTVGSAQVYRFATPPPRVTAASAAWQLSGEPILYADSWYYPTGPTIFFSPDTMVETGRYRGVPLYQDATIEPDSILYVPVARGMMRPYERPREGALAGTAGSRLSSFPTETDDEFDVAMNATATFGGVVPPSSFASGNELSAGRDRLRRGALREQPPDANAPREPAATRRNNVIQSFPAPADNSGIWVRFDGARWHQQGDAVPFDASRFVRIGDYHGFAVYRDAHGGADDIYVPAVHGGLLTHYRR